MSTALEYQRRWRKENRERQLASDRAYRKKLKDEGRLLWNARNPEKARATKRAWRKKTPDQRERACWAEILRNHGITKQEYEALLEQQGSVCAICGQANPNSRRLHVDHDHSSGKIRGLLCTNCNPMIGFAKESKDILQAAIAYIERHKL